MGDLVPGPVLPPRKERLRQAFASSGLVGLIDLSSGKTPSGAGGTDRVVADGCPRGRGPDLQTSSKPKTNPNADVADEARVRGHKGEQHEIQMELIRQMRLMADLETKHKKRHHKNEDDAQLQVGTAVAAVAG